MAEYIISNQAEIVYTPTVDPATGAVTLSVTGVSGSIGDGDIVVNYIDPDVFDPAPTTVLIKVLDDTSGSTTYAFQAYDDRLLNDPQSPQNLSYGAQWSYSSGVHSKTMAIPGSTYDENSIRLTIIDDERSLTYTTAQVVVIKRRPVT